MKTRLQAVLEQARVVEKVQRQIDDLKKENAALRAEIVKLKSW